MKTENRRDMSWDHLGSFHGLKKEKRGIKALRVPGIIILSRVRINGYQSLHQTRSY